jgi:hypothetical protein
MLQRMMRFTLPDARIRPVVLNATLYSGPLARSGGPSGY